MSAVTAPHPDEDLFRTLFTQWRRGIIVTGPDEVILFANPAAAQISGYAVEELIGRKPDILKSGQTPAEVYRDLRKALDADEIWRGEFVNRRKNGELYLEARTISAIRDAAGAVRYYVSISEDLHERQRYEQHVEYLSTFDQLTGLANRATFMRAVSAEIELARRAGHEVVLLNLDLDGFGAINNRFGADHSDRLLAEVGARVRDALRHVDLVARLSGDNFAVLLGKAAPGSQPESRDIADRLLATVARPFTIAGSPMELTASVGMAFYPADAGSADELIGCARSATHDAKAQGGNRSCRFDADMAERSGERRRLREELQGVVERGELVLHFQPQLSLHSGHIVGVEALVRWNHPQQGMLLPGDFIPLAEECGSIVAIDSWVLREACRQMQAWREAGLPPIRMAVNFSARQFRQRALRETVADALAAHAADPRCLEIEITEGAMMQDMTAAIRVTAQLKELGVRLSLDDFGTGYSSLAYLSRFPIDVVKIDQSFIRDIVTNPANAAIVQATVAMSQKLGKVVIAEGVETEEQLQFLRRSDCDEVQGFRFSPAVPADEIARMLREGARLDLSAPLAQDARETILLVDDESSILSALRRTLRREGYEILVAGSAEEGLSVLAKHPVQVIVSDQRMPGMSGTEFLSRVKVLYPRTVRMVLSGYSEISAVTDAINRGAIYRFLSKPWDDEQLKDEVRGALREWRELYGRRPA
ncbi:PAS domain S-box-containing protein/diguanylate cyclase (GGDEF) domain-containing protein [Aromatoleum tolulyticum]|uniref:PAS domain S-box-containing protein/diguanylate cyclase (GGDEF) domain-containing protein n=1 Tax=Aromatoleum tolulyticum TaxID=34027 RepID=A0A1N6ZRL8_9RHOO|nr:EAL domain-containing protein [Aromatoleum tolulyticum]SIR29510.1 PAS domain S-box-containing protein/diguanylate cyclase (GGDEF) domain-containing protein [Aromatoleum tolulyticum]